MLEHTKNTKDLIYDTIWSLWLGFVFFKKFQHLLTYKGKTQGRSGSF